MSSGNSHFAADPGGSDMQKVNHWTMVGEEPDLKHHTHPDRTSPDELPNPRGNKTNPREWLQTRQQHLLDPLY